MHNVLFDRCRIRIKSRLVPLAKRALTVHFLKTRFLVNQFREWQEIK